MPDFLQYLVYGGMQIFSLVFIPTAAMMIFVPYVVLRLRDARNSRHDGQLGIKTALHALMSVSMFVFYCGLSIVAVELFAMAQWWSDTTRMGLAMGLSGASSLSGPIVSG